MLTVAQRGLSRPLVGAAKLQRMTMEKVSKPEYDEINEATTECLVKFGLDHLADSIEQLRLKKVVELVYEENAANPTPPLPVMDEPWLFRVTRVCACGAELEEECWFDGVGVLIKFAKIDVPPVVYKMRDKHCHCVSPRTNLRASLAPLKGFNRVINKEIQICEHTKSIRTLATEQTVNASTEVDVDRTEITFRDTRMNFGLVAANVGGAKHAWPAPSYPEMLEQAARRLNLDVETNFQDDKRPGSRSYLVAMEDAVWSYLGAPSWFRQFETMPQSEFRREAPGWDWDIPGSWQ